MLSEVTSGTKEKLWLLDMATGRRSELNDYEPDLENASGRWLYRRSFDGDVARLTLAAHYDSLRLPEGFVGAIDSAAPCALLMHVARAVDDALTRKWDDLAASGMAGLGLEDERGLQILFLDGEEAWVSWTETDSLYGARWVVLSRGGERICFHCAHHT